MTLPCRFRLPLVSLLVFCLTLCLATPLFAVTHAEIQAATTSANDLYEEAQELSCVSDEIDFEADMLANDADLNIDTAERVVLTALLAQERGRYNFCQAAAQNAMDQADAAMLYFNDAANVLDELPATAQILYNI